jgi:SAM-dependent methyltransferase
MSSEGTPHGEREAWLEIVEPSDLDSHMASVGQAEANAAIVEEMFTHLPLSLHSKLLIHGCGTCQMFDYFDPSVFGNVDITFADLSPKMLDVAKRRLARFNMAPERIVVDDIECSSLYGMYDASLLVLVLLHVNWKRAIENIIRLGVSFLCVIEQVQQGGFSMTSTPQVLPSMRRFNEAVAPVLVSRDELVDFLGTRGFNLFWSKEREVSGNKSMIGLVFSR